MKKYLQRYGYIIIMIILILLIVSGGGYAISYNYYENAPTISRVDSNIQQKHISISLDNGIEINRLSRLANISQSISKTIIDECSTLDDKYLCIGNVLGVAVAESSLFKKCGTSNGCFSVMYRNKNGVYQKISFDTIEDSIIHFIKLYKKNKWYLRRNGQARLDGKYCTSACTYWVKNYESGRAIASKLQLA